MKTAANIKNELQACIAEFFELVEKLTDRGQTFQGAVISVCQARPDLVAKDASLRAHLAALGPPLPHEVMPPAIPIEQSLSAADLRDWAERQREGALSCATVTRLAGAVRRLPVAQLGVRYKGKQKIEITRPMLAEVVANFRKRDTGEVPIDYDHSIETAAGNGAAVPAAGWIKSLDDVPDAQGILWGSVVWTPKAARMIEDGEYKFISPVIDPGVRDNRNGDPQGWTLTSAALTNQPVLQGMPALVLSEGGQAGLPREERSVGNNEWDAMSVEVNDRVKATMAVKGLSYASAMQALMLDDRDLARRYQAAKKRYLANDGTSYRTSTAGSEISPLVKAKIAASEGTMDYGVALRMVLNERPDLARRYKDEMR